MSLSRALRIRRPSTWLTAGLAVAASLALSVAPVAAGDPGSDPRQLATVGDRVLWLADDTTHGDELWRTDGTTTTLLKDLNPGSESSGAGLLVAGTTKAWYGAFDGTDLRIWRSNGTRSGTIPLTDVTPAGEAFAIGDRAYYPAYEDATGVELYTSDGSVAGTKRITDLVAGAGSGVVSIAFGRIGARVAFVGFGADAAPELFISGPTSGSAKRLTQLPGTASIDWLESAAGFLYLEVQPSSGTYELWKSDGTKSGTLKVRSLPGPVQARAAVGSRLYFAVADAAHGSELWRSDGTAASTRMVKDGVPGMVGSNPQRIVRLGPGVVFMTVGAAGTRLWHSDGTKGGTAVVKRINPDGDSEMTGFRVAGGRVYFFADDGTHGLEPWRSDGTRTGTRMVEDVFPGSSGSLTSGEPEFVGLDGRVYFPADDGVHGIEIWRTTRSGAKLWADVGKS